MNVLHINCNYVTSKLHKTMLEHYTDSEIKNTVFSPVSTGADIKEESGGSVYIRKCFNNYDRLLYYVKQRKIYEELMKTVLPCNYNLTHAYTVFTDGGIAYKLKKEYGIPYIIAVRNTDVNVFFKYCKYLWRYGIEILKNAERVIFLSQSYKDRIMQYIPEQFKNELDEKCLIIPNGIDDFWHENIYNKIKFPLKKELNICFAGRVDRNKNCMLTIKACDRLIKEGYKITYTVIGQMADKSTEKRIKKREYIKYVPPVGKEKLIKIYRNNDIFVMPSKTESFGLVYAEAMSQGLPVIYTKNEGFDGQFSEGTVGYHVSSKNSEELAEIIKKVAEAYDNLSSRCIQNIDNFNWSLIVELYCKEYKKIVKSSGFINV